MKLIKDKNYSEISLQDIFNQHLDSNYVYEIIFENKNPKCISSQFIRIISRILSVRIFGFKAIKKIPSFVNHIAQVYCYKKD